jgi:hypothetical protein
VLQDVFVVEKRFLVARELAASVLEERASPTDRETGMLCGIASVETVRVARSEVTEIWRRSKRDLSFIGDLSESRRRGRPRRNSGRS